MNTIFLNKQNDNESRIFSFFTSFNEDFYLTFFTILSSIGMLFPYNQIIKLIYAVFIIFCMVLFVFKRPELVIPTFILTSINPIRSYTGLFDKDIYFLVLDNHSLITFSFLVIIIIQLMIQKKINFKSLCPYIVFVIMLGFSWFITDDYTRKTYYTFSFWSVFIVYCIIPFFVKKEKDFMVIVKSFIYGSIQTAVCFIIFIFLNNFNSFSNVTLDTVEIMDRNYFSVYLVLIVACTFVYAVLNKNNNKLFTVLYYCSAVLNCILILILASRTALISLVVITVVLILFLIKKQKNKFLFLAISLIFIFAVYYSGIANVVLERFNSDDIQTVNGRSEIAIKMLKIFSERNLFEVLFGTGHNSVFVYHLGTNLGTHNTMLSCLMHYGVIGLISYCSVFGVLIFKILKYKRFRKYSVLLIVLLLSSLTLEIHIQNECIIVLIGLLSVRDNEFLNR